MSFLNALLPLSYKEESTVNSIILSTSFPILLGYLTYKPILRTSLEAGGSPLLS